MKKRQTQVTNLDPASKCGRRFLFDGASELVYRNQEWRDDQQYDQHTNSNQDVAKGTIHGWPPEGGTAVRWAASAIITHVNRMKSIEAAAGERL